jgi:AcrR family transcriptional regulator
MAEPTRTRLAPSDRRVLLMDAAARTFARLGYEDARMEDVADEAGVAKGLLYRHFPSKEALFSSLMEEREQRFSDRLRAAFDATPRHGERPDPTTLIAAGIAAWLDEAARDDSLLAWTEPRHDDLVAPYRDQALSVIADQIAAVEPGVDSEVAWLVAAAFQGAIEATTAQWKRRRGTSRDVLEALQVAFATDGLTGLGQLRRFSDG